MLVTQHSTGSCDAVKGLASYCVSPRNNVHRIYFSEHSLCQMRHEKERGSTSKSKSVRERERTQNERNRTQVEGRERLKDSLPWKCSWLCKHQFDRKNPLPPEPRPPWGVFFVVWFPNWNPEEEDPPWTKTPNLSKIVGFLQRGSSSSGFWVWNPLNKEPLPGGGGVLKIKLISKTFTPNLKGPRKKWPQ